jgi:hypothetical protein
MLIFHIKVLKDTNTVETQALLTLYEIGIS